mgnify:CR=1 FL=1
MTDKELIDHGSRIVRDETIVAPIYELVHSSEVQDMQLTPASLEYIGRNLRAYPDKFRNQKVAVVASSDVMFGMARMYAMLGETQALGNTIKTFRDEASAMEWLRSVGYEGD